MTRLMSVQRKLRNSKFLLFLIVTAITVIMRIPEFYAPLGRDGGVFAYIGRRVLAGDVPYRDVWDHKAPAVYYLDALALVLSGHTIAGLRCVEIVFAVATAWVIYQLGSKLLQSHWAASLSSLSFALISNGYLFSSGADLHFTEAFMQLPTVLSIHFAVLHRASHQWRYLFWSGMMAGCAILFKPTAGFTLIALALWTTIQILKKQRPWGNVFRCLMALIAGAGLLLILTLAYFALRGGLADLYSQVIEYNSLYAAAHFQRGFFQTLASHVSHWVGALGFVWIPASVGLVWGKGSPESRWLLVFWFIADLAGATVGGKHLPHYFLQVLPSLTLLAGSGWLTLKDRHWLIPRGLGRISLITMITATLLVLLIRQTASALTWISFRLDGNLATAERAARFVANDTAKDETIYVWGTETVVYLLSGRRSASRYAYLYPLLTTGYSSPHKVNELLQDLKEQAPRYILDASATNREVPSLKDGRPRRGEDPIYAPDTLEPVRQFILQRYHPKTHIDGWTVYERVALDED